MMEGGREGGREGPTDGQMGGRVDGWTEERMIEWVTCLLDLHFFSLTSTAVYTLFALCEYFTIVSNIAFHWHCTWIFTEAQLALGYFENSTSKAR